MSLYELPEAIRACVEEGIDPVTGEILSEDMEANLDALTEEFDAKAEWIALLSREAKAEAEAVGLERKRLEDREQRAKAREKRLKSYLLSCMIAAGRHRIEGELVVIRIQKSPPSYQWMGELDGLPEEYRRVEISPDIAKLRDDVKGGVPLPEGFRIEQGKHVRIQ